MNEQLVRCLLDELSGFDISVTQHQAELLVTYLDLVIQKNKVVNLTRITNPEEAVTLHLVDSLLPLAVPGVQLDEKVSLLDMGTGAGFPGVPLAVVSGAQALLVDSVRKKTDAVSEFVAELRLSSIQTRHARLEELAREIPKSMDMVIARAVAQTNVLLEYATPFLRTNGILVVEKGRPDDEELRVAQRAATTCGMKLVSRETFELPQELGHRDVLVYQRVAKPRIGLPRKVGLAKNKPLGL